MTELKPGGEAPMIAISLPPVEAWQLLHDNLDVLNLPTPAPTEPCTHCDKLGNIVRTYPIPNSPAATVSIDLPCTKGVVGADGLCRSPVEVLIYATDERPPLDPLVGFGRFAGWEYVNRYDIHDTSQRLCVWTSPVYGTGELVGSVQAGAVVGVATITGSHEGRMHEYPPNKKCYCPRDGSASFGVNVTYHWLVGSVCSITPIPWENNRCSECGHRAHSANMCFNMASDNDCPCKAPSRFVWSVPDELAEQETT